jgi:hypothetical protein
MRTCIATDHCSRDFRVSLKWGCIANLETTDDATARHPLRHRQGLTETG